jgi:hypothetical protein
MPDLLDGTITLVAVLAMLGAALWISRRDRRRRHDAELDRRIEARYRHGG